MTTAASGAPPPKKRRRRTAASGATDDCFTCRKRGDVVCDRKRPYCTQCIEIGRECSGYKTTLTWGVGVASRGKLRGLSCPVTGKSGKVAVDVNDGEIEVRRRKRSGSAVKDEDRSDVHMSNGTNHYHQPPHFSGPTSAPSHTPAFQPTLPTITSGQQGWHVPGYQDHLQAQRSERPSVLRHHSLQHIHTALGPQYDAHGMPTSGSSVGSFADAEFHSPLEHPHTPGSTTYTDPFSQSAPASYTSQPLSSSVDSWPDTLSSSVDSIHSGASLNDTISLEPPRTDFNNFNQGIASSDDVLFSPSYEAAYNPFDVGDIQQQDGNEQEAEKSLALFDPRFGGPFFHVTPRLQSLMEYYDRHICPYLVAFDGPENPYRKYILQLAMQNEGLQNAVAALATNNLRMRQAEPRRQMGFVEEITDAFDGTSKNNQLNEPTPEETCYKQMSIDQLNMQLTDTRAAQDDSVLATLLILCLFHVCDSGFSKFKTQLAGVQKLLSLRSPHGDSDFTKWIEMFFIWFDVMTSAVNDREMQIKGESLDMLDYSANLGALEQFSGCDGRLFKLIARLGRLNLLAQGRPVKDQGKAVPRPPTMSHNPFQRSSPPMRKKFPHPRSLSVADYDNLDGNGWGTPILSSSDDESNAGSGDERHTTSPAPDARHEFWSEWTDIRTRLQTWQMDIPFNNTPPPATSTTVPEFEMGQRDMLHINESFRYSALLYTERLGHPVLPSSHFNFQKYVSKALMHITALEITSCVNKFLLWPLFITGTECVDEGHRNIIRARCIEVQKESGFYNNISGLEVLEKVWREVGNNVQGMEAAEIKARRRDSEAGRTGRYGQAFRWRKAMDRVDGEYVVV